MKNTLSEVLATRAEVKELISYLAEICEQNTHNDKLIEVHHDAIYILEEALAELTILARFWIDHES